MSSDIPLVSLRDAGVKLIDCVHKTPEAVESGFPYVAIPQMVEGRLDIKAARRISERDMQAWNTKCDPKEGDVVLSRRCNPGVTAVIPKGFKGSLGQNLVLLRASNGRITPEYLRWATRGREWWNEVDRYINVGAVFESLRCADIPEFQIPLPSLPDQKAIAHILGTLDDKIELNRKTNETLEAMARALFKSWFVDVDPVRAKAEGRPTGLPDEISDIFPALFEESELGEIPAGWQVKCISDITERVAMGPFGSNIKVETFVDSGIPIISGAHLKGILLEDSEFRFITEEHAQRLSNSCVHRGDVVFTHAGSIGQVAIIPDRSKYSIYVLSQRQFYARPLRQVYRHYIALYFHTAMGRHDLLSNTSQTGVPSIARPATFLKSIRLTVPGEELLCHFEEIVSSIANKIKCAQENMSYLGGVRDALLPKLISGELRIPEAERLLEEAGV
jgi:type I restriction enzyme S subunit